MIKMNTYMYVNMRNIRKHKPATISTNVPDALSMPDTLENRVTTLLNQYPFNKLRLTWTMRIHIKTCEECKYHLRYMVPGSAQLPKPLASLTACQICDET